MLTRLRRTLTCLAALVFLPVAASASAATTLAQDPVGDTLRARVDIVSARISFTDLRLSVRTRFVKLSPGTSYFAYVDPGRRLQGPEFALIVRMRKDGTTTGSFAWGPANSPYQFAPCPGLRTSSRASINALRVSVPTRCLARYGHVAARAWVQIEAGASADFLPEPPQALHVSRIG
jgi:hypothetical protein